VEFNSFSVLITLVAFVVRFKALDVLTVFAPISAAFVAAFTSPVPMKN
jgi:hypothetical protein